MQTLHLPEVGQISYLTQGSDSPTFLLVHNAGGNHEMLHPAIRHLAKKGRVLAPDLPGHGASAHPQLDYTPTLFAQSLIQLCAHEKASPLVFIGLNYGANVGIEIARLAPHLLSHLVLIEPPFFMEPWITQVVEEQIRDLKNPRPAWADETVNALLPNAPQTERDIARKALKSTPAFVKISTYKELLSWDKSHNFTCQTPTLLIQASKPFCHESQVRQVFPHLQVGRVVGSGPWATLEVPAQVHAMVDRFLGL